MRARFSHAMATGVGSAADSFTGVTRRGMRFIVAAASSGTIIEWYDFYIFVTLGFILTPLFFKLTSDPAINFLAFLATYASGFAVRPFGAIVFGRIGDLIGRKYAFLLTVTIMGLGTAAIAFIPVYAAIGILAPLALMVLRCVQGLALGGEYGGAAIYVAEHAPDEKRGYWTSYIQTTATVGLFLSLIVILATSLSLGTVAFADWGWRIPFLLSSVLVAAALYIRWRLRETPLFTRLKEMGRTAKSPIRESLGTNWRLILLALFGATAGQAVVWYTGQFYALFFLQNIRGVDKVTSYAIVATALALGTPLFIFFGRLSYRIGRKKIIMAGCLLAAVTYYPLYVAMSYFSDTATFNVPALILLVLIQVVYVTMVYGPIAALLVEMFPGRTRYTSLSLPYHLGNGEFGGFTPVLVVAINVATGSILAGLIYPIGVALATFIIGTLYIKETKDVSIWKEVEIAVPATQPLGRSTDSKP